MIPLRIHNILDYVIAALLVLAPFVFGFSDIEIARDLFVVLGVGLASYSLITRYYYSLAKIIPVGVHMVFDTAAGAVILAAPYVTGYRENLTSLQLGVHLVMGLGAIGLVAVTKPRTESAMTIEEQRAIMEHSFSTHRHV